MRDAALKPCPFCGSAGAVVSKPKPNGDGYRHRVQCDNVGCAAEAGKGWWDDFRLAVVAWNQRIDSGNVAFVPARDVQLDASRPDVAYLLGQVDALRAVVKELEGENAELAWAANSGSA